MSFITATDVLQDVSDALKQSGPGALPAWWTNIATQAVNQAYYDVLGALLERGFSKAQVDAWDRLNEFGHDLALMYSLKRGAAVESIDPKMLELLDRRKELCNVQVFASGVWQRPQDAQQQGTVGFGAESTGGDTFVWPDPDDGRIGEVTRW